MTLYENIITRDSSLNKDDGVQDAYELMKLFENIVLLEASWVDAAKKVVKDRQYLYINPKNNQTSDEKKKGFVLLDATTANMLVKIVDALSKVNKEKFSKTPITQAIDIGWKIVSK